MDKLIGSGLEGMGQSLPASPGPESRPPHCMDICLDTFPLWLIFIEALTKLVVSGEIFPISQRLTEERHRCQRSCQGSGSAVLSGVQISTPLSSCPKGEVDGKGDVLSLPGFSYSLRSTRHPG